MYAHDGNVVKLPTGISRLVRPHTLAGCCRFHCMETFHILSEDCLCVPVCRHTCFTRTSASPVYCFCDCARHAVCVPAGHRGSGVRKRKLASPFGRCPNWLCAADRMLTEHTEQTGSALLSVAGFSQEDFLVGVPSTRIIFNMKENP